MPRDHVEKPSQFFDADMATSYDERHRNLSAITENMHFLAGLILKDLPAHARVLCVGVGTGTEIISLAKAYPNWTFVGVDPSEEMLSVCRDKLEGEGILDRCELIHGYINDVHQSADFDAVVSFLVAHFIDRDDRGQYYEVVYNTLKAGGYFISLEISYDLTSDEFPSMLEKWKSVHEMMGATKESLQNLPMLLQDKTNLVTPEETVRFWKDAGFLYPVLFFQSLLVHGWYSTK
jgi:tRNA (cmo5U34)-methyltransferase